jgi:hypothetical protein
VEEFDYLSPDAMTVSYGIGELMGDDYTPRFTDGRPMFVGLKGEALSALESGKLLADYRKRRVAKTLLRNRRKKFMISTVLLVLDHGFMSTELYKTMIFGGLLDGYQDRYATRAEAKKGHGIAVIAARSVIRKEEADRARRRRMHASYHARRA